MRQLGGENLVSAAQMAYLMEVQRLLADPLAAAECHGARGKIMDLMWTVIRTTRYKYSLTCLDMNTFFSKIKPAFLLYLIC